MVIENKDIQDAIDKGATFLTDNDRRRWLRSENRERVIMMGWILLFVVVIIIAAALIGYQVGTEAYLKHQAVELIQNCTGGN